MITNQPATNNPSTDATNTDSSTTSPSTTNASTNAANPVEQSTNPATTNPATTTSPAAPTSRSVTTPAPLKHPELGVTHQMVGDVRRMLNERANALAYRNIERVNKIDYDLRAMGYTGDLTAPVGGGDQAPVGRASTKPGVTAPVVTAGTPAATTPAPSSTKTTAP